MYWPWLVSVTVFLHTSLSRFCDHVLDCDVQLGEGPVKAREHFLEYVRSGGIDRHRGADQRVGLDESSIALDLSSASLVLMASWKRSNITLLPACGV
jgi:hypothetical protein